jgi:hypothetical protein
MEVTRRVVAILVVALATITLAGCPKLEQNAYNTVVAANAFVKDVRARHPECASSTSTTLCNDLARATSAKDVLIDALETYCAGPNFNTGGACDAPAKGTPAAIQGTAKLQSALDSYKQAATDLKGVIK